NELKESPVAIKDEPIDSFAEIKQEEPIADASYHATDDELKEEPMEMKDEPIDDLKQEEPTVDIFCPSTGSSRPLVQSTPLEITCTKSLFACSECDQEFARKVTLNRHMLIHAGEKPFSCIYCGVSFLDKSTLTAHIRQVHKEKPYSCLTCGKKFDTHSDMKKHLLFNRGHVD
ncbi:hypothetical protein PMAYCL1PPCAC_04986, partial [Pristionchus mayeri]